MDDSSSDTLSKNAVLQHGEEFGDYQIESCLTTGLLGRIYHALHMDSSQTFSICVLPHKASQDARLGGRLRRYAQQASGLHHPNLLAIYEWRIIRGRFCLIMEPISGRSLATLRRDKIEELDEGFDSIGWETTEAYDADDISFPPTFGFGERWTHELATNLAEIVSYLQEKGLAHGALAPNYVFVDATGRVQSALGGLLSVLGKPLFEIIVSAEILPVDGTREERQVNVIDTLSPEVQAGQPPSVMSDLYAIGILLYWIYTGKLYSALPTYLSVSTLRPDISSKWSDLVDSLLETDPNTRLNSPSSFLYWLTETEAQAATVEAPAHVEEKVVKKTPKKKSKLSLVLIILIAVFLLGGVGLGLYLVLGGNSPEPDTPIVVRPKLAPWSKFTVVGAPGASVLATRIDGSEITVGTIPESGRLVADKVLRVGKYFISATHPDYRTPLPEELSLKKGKEAEVLFEMTPLPSNAEFWSIPNGVNIHVNGELRGRTPLRISELPSGQEISVEARLEGYRSLEQRVSLEPNSTVVIDFGELKKKEAFLAPRVALQGETDPAAGERLRILVNGDLAEIEDGKVATAPGIVELTIQHPEYQELSQQFVVGDAQIVEFQASLTPKPAYVRLTGDFDEGTEIFRDGQKLSFQKSNDVVIEVTPRVAHQISVRKRDHFPYAETVLLKPNEQASLQPILKRIPGPVVSQAWTIPYLNLKIQPVAPGEAIIGSPLPEHARLPNEGPIVKRAIDKPFWAGVYEVSQREYFELTGENPSSFTGLDNPVESVSWADAMAFCKILTERERLAQRLPAGYEYRLPTELEWEYFARAQNRSPFNWGEEAHGAFGNFDGVYPRGSDFGKLDRDHYGTVRVGSYEANAWGLFDIHGNVREWTLDIYSPKPPDSPKVDADGPQEFLRRTQRGGGWEDRAPACRSASRLAVNPELVSHAAGFRIVLAPVIE